MKNFSKKKQLDKDGVEQEGISIPISIGPARNELDNAGVSSSAYDVIVNPDVLKDAADDKTG